MKHRFFLTPAAPYDFELTNRIFGRGDPEMHQFADGELREVVHFEDVPTVVRIRSVGSTGRPRLKVSIESRRKLSQAKLAGLRKYLSRQLHIDLHLRRFYHAIAGDPVLASLVRQLRGLSQPAAPEPFEALVYAIAEQQISLSASHSMEVRLVRKFGERVPIEGGFLYAFPTADRLARATVAGLMACGLSRRKSEYIQNAARMIARGELELEDLAAHPRLEDAVAELSRLRGVGRWTAEYVLVRGLGRLDSAPADDVGIRRSVSRFYFRNRRVGGDRVRRLTERWGKWKGLAVFYIMAAARLGLRAD